MEAGEQGNFKSKACDIWNDLQSLRHAQIDQQKPDGIYVWTQEDRPPYEIKPGGILTGEHPLVKNLRDGYFAPRNDLYLNIANKAIDWIDQNPVQSDKIARLPVFWIGGRSGSGKSVALLHVLAICHEWGYGPILYLGNKVELLPETISWGHNVLDKRGAHCSVIIALDDPYSAAVQQDAEKIWQRGLSKLEAFRQSGVSSEIPVLICCGPTEQARRLKDDFLEDVSLNIFEIPFETKSDYDYLRDWYQVRTGKEAPLVGDENVLLVQLFFEWEVGSSLSEFGRRFLNRIKDMDRDRDIRSATEETLVDIFSKILVLNRLYIGYPEEAAKRYLVSSIEDDIELLRKDHHHLELNPRSDRKGYWIAHPHLSNAVFESWYSKRRTSERREILRKAIIDCVKWGKSPVEQMAPLWAISQALSLQDQHLSTRLDLDQIPNLLQSLYTEWPASKNSVMPLPHLPVWIQLRTQCKQMQFNPDPVRESVKRLTYDNLDEQGLRLTCHKLLEHYNSFTDEVRQQIIDAIFDLLSSSKDWFEWHAVAEDVLRRINDTRFIPLVAEWIRENYRNPKASKLLLKALKHYPRDPYFLLVSKDLLRIAGPNLIWGDIAIQLLEADFANCPLEEIKIWAENNCLEFGSCFLLRKLLECGIPRANTWALEWVQRHHLEPSANFVLESLCLSIKDIPDQLANYCIRWIDQGHKTCDRLLEKLIIQRPDDDELRFRGFRWLDTTQKEDESWGFIWNALWKARHDTALVKKGKEYLNEGPSNHASWGYIWLALWKTCQDEELTELGKSCLRQLPLDHGSWNYVWEALWKEFQDRELTELGKSYVKQLPFDHESWGHIWLALWKTCQDKELTELGKSCVRQLPFDHGFWSPIWLALWKSCQDEELTELGKNCLRQLPFDHGSWNFIWEALWKEFQDRELTELRKSCLRQLPLDHGSWGHIWLALWKTCQDEELAELGEKWLKQHHPYSYYNIWRPIWLALWKSCQDEEVAELGIEYLKQVPFSHKTWHQIWLAFWQTRQNTHVAELGRGWLKRLPFNHDSWPNIWLCLWESQKNNQYAELGKECLRQLPFDHGSWNHIWLALWKFQKDDQLARLAIEFLKRTPSSQESWSLVADTLWQSCNNEELARLFDELV